MLMGRQALRASHPQVSMDRNRIRIFCGRSNPELAKEICAHSDVPLGQCIVSRFSDGEVRVQILENVRGADVFVVQPTCNPVDTSLMELLLMMDALKRAGSTKPADLRLAARRPVQPATRPSPRRSSSPVIP